MDDLWSALEKIEKRDGEPALIKNLLTASFRNADASLGNWFWYTFHAEICEAIEEAGVNRFDGEELMRQVGRPGGWNRMWQPRALVWANKCAQTLVGDYQSRAAAIPVVTSTVRAFDGVAIRQGQIEFILINLPLVIGLVAMNGLLAKLLETVGEDWPWISGPELLWPGRVKRQLDELVQKHNETMLWVNNPSSQPPFDFSTAPGERENSFACYQVLFILLHELAHFKAGHIASTTEATAPKFQTEPTYLFSVDWQQEFDADEIAMDWFLGLTQDEKHPHGLLGLAITFLFHCLMTLEGLRQVGSSDGKFGSHPPAGLRWARLCLKLPEAEQSQQVTVVKVLSRVT